MGACTPFLHFILLPFSSGHGMAQVSLKRSSHYITLALRCDQGPLSFLSLAFKALLAIPRHVHASADASSLLENPCRFLPPALQEATPMQLFHRDAPGDLSSVGTSPLAWPLERPPQPAAPLAQVWSWISQLGRALHPQLPVPAAPSRVPGRLHGW